MNCTPSPEEMKGYEALSIPVKAPFCLAKDKPKKQYGPLNNLADWKLDTKKLKLFFMPTCFDAS